MVWNGANYPQEYPDDCEGQCMCRACTACITVVEQERDEAVAARDAALRLGAFTAMKYTQQLEVGLEMEAHIELLEFCLDQARIVLEHFRTELLDPEDRRIAEGAMIASAPPGTLSGE